jgi:glycosyltransferase involved in cell wall biosynthesis
VITVPNGVDVSAAAAVPDDARTGARCIGFWGNLAFAPNREAMRFFFDRIYLPFLASSGVEVRIVGHGAEASLGEIAARHPQVRLLGFVEDLSTALRGCPVMINPMVSGSGMKNKVLEAFVRRMAVVTTRLGVEAFPGVRADEHARIVDEPAAFAAGILQLLDAPAVRQTMTDRAHRLVTESYSWDAVGRPWRQAVEAKEA